MIPTMHLRLAQSERDDIYPPVLQQWFVKPINGSIFFHLITAEPEVHEGEWRTVPIKYFTVG